MIEDGRSVRGGVSRGRGAWFWLFLPFPLLVLPCSAQKLTLKEALRLAEAESPLLKAAQAGIERAAAGTVTAKAYPNPNASSQTGRQMVLVPGNVSGAVQILSFSQPLELGKLRPARLNAAERGREIAELNLEARRLEVLSGVRRSFYEVLRRQGEVEILRENLKLVEDLRRRIQVRVDVGEAPRLELVRADAEVATARAQVNSGRMRIISALAGFRAAVGGSLPADVVLEGELEAPPRLPPLGEMEQQVISTHPALRLARLEGRRAEAQVELERALRRPQPSVRVDFEKYPDVPNWRLGLDIPLPFWNRREGPIAEAVAQTRQARAEEQARRVELLAALEGAYGRYQAAAEQVAAYETGVLKEAEAALRAAETAYRLGERGIIDVLDAQRLLRTVRLEYLNMRFDRQGALVDLDELRAVDPREAVR
jgi:cobalt-zinc-cadmium efflux system outer membrane protein